MNDASKRSLSAPSRKVLLIGLDSASFQIIRPWAKQGLLPNLKQFMDRSSYAPLESIPPITPAGWTSLASGLNVGRHGISDFFAFDRNTYGVRPIHGRDVPVKRIWDYVTDHGGKSIVVNYPITYPPDHINGIMISGLDTPGDASDLMHPASLRDELASVVGQYWISAEQMMTEASKGSPDHGVTNNYKYTLPDRLRILTDLRTKTAHHLITRYPWDLFALVFLAPDIICHAWFGDVFSGKEDNTGFITRDGLSPDDNPVLHVYQQVDRAIGTLVDAVSDDTVIVVVSDHGIGPLDKHILLNTWLHRQGFLAFNKSSPDDQPAHEQFRNRSKASRNRPGPRKKMIRGIPRRIIRALCNRFYKKHTHHGHEPGEDTSHDKERISPGHARFTSIDWSRTRAFAWGNLSSITINLKGRQAQGIVRPGNEYEALMTEITKRLKQIRDPTTGNRLVADVARADDHFHGPYTPELPDLYMVTRGLRTMGKGLTPLYRDDVPKELFETPEISATHRFHGIFMACEKKAIRDKHTQSTLFRQKLSDAEPKIIDVAPTILYILGLPVPKNLDGRVVEDMFIPDLFEKQPPVYRSMVLKKDAAPLSANAIFSPEEEAMLADRLRQLGYEE